MSSVVGGVTNLVGTAMTNNANMKSNRTTNETNREIAEQNLEFQKDNLDYQKALQQQIFAREDSAYQRTVQDMRAAGISPLAMQGTNGAGEAIQVGSLNNQFQAQSPAPRIAPDLSVFGGVVNDLFDIAQRYQELKQSKLKTSYDEQTLGDRVAFQNGLTLLQSYEMFDKEQKKNFNDYFGTHSEMTPQERFVFVMRKMLNPTFDGGLNQSHKNPFSDNQVDYSNLFDYHNITFDSMANNMIDKFKDYAEKFESFNKAKEKQGADFGFKDLLPLLQYMLN